MTGGESIHSMREAGTKWRRAGQGLAGAVQSLPTSWASKHMNLVKRASVAAAIVIVIIVLVLTVPMRFHRGVTPMEMTTTVNSELPGGTEVSKVLAFLDSRKIEHSEYHPGERTILAIKRDACWALMMTCSIDMKFVFDVNNRLEKLTTADETSGL
jgi:hypothetical protein